MSRLLEMRLVRIADLAGSLVLFGLVEGFNFGGSDDLAFTPWVDRIDDPSLLENDIRFGEWPAAYYFGHILYFWVISKIVPIEWGIILSSVATRLILLLAMQRLMEAIAGRFVPTLLLVFVMIGYFNNHLVGGYYLWSHNFSTHYVGLALIILATSWLLQNRPWRSAAAVAVAAPFNPRLGLIGAAWLLGLWSLTLSVKRRTLLYVSGAFAGIALVVLLEMRGPGGIDPATFEEVVRVWMYMRSPGHYAPEYWDQFVFPNLFIVTSFLVTLLCLYREEIYQKLGVLSLICIVGIFVGIANNTYKISNTLVFMNPFQFGPLVLAVCYVFVTVVLYDRMREGRYLSTLAILAFPDLQAKLLLMIATLLVDRVFLSGRQLPAAGGPVRRDEWPVLLVQVVVAIVMAFVMSQSAWQQIAYASASYFWRFALVGGVAVVVLLSWYWRPLTPVLVAVALALGQAAMTFKTRTVAGIRLTHELDPNLVPLCDYVRANTDKDAVFIVPPLVHQFQWHCRRAAFADYAHLPLRLERMPEWFARLGLLGIVPAGVDAGTLSRVVRFDFEAYDRRTAEDFIGVSRRYAGVEYVLTPATTDLALPIFYENPSFRLYRLE